MAEKTRFRNQSEGFIGVNVYDDDHKRNAISVAPGSVVELSEAEQQMTADAPRDPENNPFVGGWRDADGKTIGPALVLAEDSEVRRPVGRPTGAPQEEHAADPEPPAEPETGSRPSEEEVATPEAPAKRNATARKRTPVAS